MRLQCKWRECNNIAFILCWIYWYVRQLLLPLWLLETSHMDWWGLRDHALMGSLRAHHLSLTNCQKVPSLLSRGNKALLESQLNKHIRKFFLWLKVQFIPNHQAFLTHTNAVSHLRTMNKLMGTKAKLFVLSLGNDQHLLPGEHIFLGSVIFPSICGCCSAGFPSSSQLSFYLVAKYLQLCAYYTILGLPWKIRETWGS